MVRINFTEEEVRQLRKERFNHPHPRVQLRMDALLLKSQGLEHRKICKILGVCHDTLTGYLREYQSGGIEALKKLNSYRPKSKLEDYRETLEEEFKNNPPATVKHAVARIKELTGIERSEVQVGKFLKKNRAEAFKGSSDTCKG